MAVVTGGRSRATRRALLLQALATGIGAPAVLGFGRSAHAGPETTGRWSARYVWPDVACHTHLLPTSNHLSARVLSFTDDDVPGLRDRNGGFSKAFVVDIPAGGRRPAAGPTCPTT